MIPTKKLAGPAIGILLFVICLSLSATPALAYEEDTHFGMTYVICRSVGFTPQEAMIVAAVNQGMDDSTGTVANTGFLGMVPQETEEWSWHALDLKGKMGAAGIIRRKEELFRQALNESGLRNRLIRLGVFFHYQQDTWAHRHHQAANHLSRTDYTTYNTPLGHAIDGHQPDRPPYDPVAALMNLEDGIAYARTFMKEGLERTPGAFFDNYKSEGGDVDKDWKGDKNYFRQISLAGAAPNSARAFLLALIRAQIDTYSYEPDIIQQRYAREANFDSVRNALNKVCKDFEQYRSAGIRSPEIIVPELGQKRDQEFLNLTTQMLNGSLPVYPQYVAIGTDRHLYTRNSLRSRWEHVEDSGEVSAIAIGPDKMIAGIGNDNSLFARLTLKSPWVKMPTPKKFIAGVIGMKGLLIGVGLDNKLYRFNLFDWIEVPESGYVTGITMAPNGSLIGIGMDGTLFTRESLDARWKQVSNTSGKVTAISLAQDGTLLGVGLNKQIYTRATIESSWVHVPDTGNIIAIAEMPLANKYQ